MGGKSKNNDTGGECDDAQRKKKLWNPRSRKKRLYEKRGKKGINHPGRGGEGGGEGNERKAGKKAIRRKGRKRDKGTRPLIEANNNDL